MAFTLNQAVTEVRAIINEETASYWSDTEIQSWIAQGCLDWCEKTLSYILEDTITLTTNTVQYTTSTNSYIDNAMLVLHAEHNNKALKRLRYEQLRGHNAPAALGSDAAPKYFYDQYDGTTFTFYIAPTPSSTYNNTLVTVLFASRTDDITALPYEYQQQIFLYAASKAKAKERQFSEASLFWQQYINNIQFARLDSLEHGAMETERNFRVN